MAKSKWASSDGRERHILVAINPEKIFEVYRLHARHAGPKTLVFADYLDQKEAVVGALDVPLTSSEARHRHREAYSEALRDGDLDTLVVSRIDDEGIDPPDVGLAIVTSGFGGSRQQGSQHAGRVVRPTGSTFVYVLATRGTSRGDFAQRQIQHLAEKNIRVRETSTDDLDLGPDDGNTDTDIGTEDDGSDGAESASADSAESVVTDR